MQGEWVMNHAAISACAAAVVAIAACSRSEQPPPVSATMANSAISTSVTKSSTTTTSAAGLSATQMPQTAGRIMNDDAAMLLTNARCERESSCGNVGARRRFGDRDRCARDLFPEARLALREEECPLGVDRDKLSLCASEVQMRACDVPRATIREPASCSRVELCAGR
jgi:hypothetical protein